MQLQKFLRAFAQIHRDETSVTRDTVLLVHHRIANLYFGQIAQQAFGAGARFFAAT